MSLLPDWNSIESTSRWSDILFWAGIVCLILLAVAEIGSHIYGSRSSFLVGEAVRLAGIQRNTDEAAAKEKSDAESAQLRDKLAKAERIATEASEKAKELDRLRQPRRLTGNQKTRLFDLLAAAPKGKLTIKASVNDPDASDYGKEIAAVFARADWTVPVENALFAGGDTSGIWITVRNAQIPEVAQTVYSALREAGIPIREGALGDENGPAADEAWLKIGSIK
jgi:hypothetical protein